ncbi:MAG: alpha/beta hydrolase [Burkholderiaceae bacterium]
MVRTARHLPLSHLAAAAGAAWLGAVAVITARQRRLLFDPVHDVHPSCPRCATHDIGWVAVRAADGTLLRGWLARPKTAAKSAAPHPAAIYFGGRAEEVSWAVRHADRMCPGIALLAVNYRGSGGSRGTPTERRLIDDGQLLYDWLVARDGIDPARIAIVGRSLGCGVAVPVAAQMGAQMGAQARTQGAPPRASSRPAAVVLISPFDSVLAMVRKKLPAMPVGWMLRDPFETVRHAGDVAAPVLVLRAAHDDIVPHVHTDRLTRRLPNVAGDLTIPGSHHGDVPFLPATQDEVGRFLRARLLGTPARADPAARECVARAA